MKKFVGIALVLALALSTAAIAEGTTEPTPAADPVLAMESAVTEEATTEEASPAEKAAPQQTEDALQDALDAYRAAKQDKAVSDLEAELNGYVEAGSLTQEQADLILKNVKEQVAAMKGECPSCGYQFSNGGKLRGRMGGQHQNRGQQRGRMPGNNQGSQQRGQMPGNQMPGMNGLQRGNQMPGNQMPGMNGQQRPDAQSGATPQGPMNGQQGQLNGQMPQQRNGGQQMPGQMPQHSEAQNGTMQQGPQM